MKLWSETTLFLFYSFSLVVRPFVCLPIYVATFLLFIAFPFSCRILSCLNYSWRWLSSRSLRCVVWWTLMREAAGTSETLVNFYLTTRQKNQEDRPLHARRHENVWTQLFPSFCFDFSAESSYRLTDFSTVNAVKLWMLSAVFVLFLESGTTRYNAEVLVHTFLINKNVFRCS
jgi:hypothetical protein